MKKTLNTGRRILYSILAFTMILSMLMLTACNDKGVSDDPNLGVWKATTGEMLGISIEVADMFGKGFTIELKAGGKCSLNVDGEKANGKWTLDGVEITVKGGGIDCEGRLENGKLTLEDVMGMGLTLIFEREGGYDGPITREGRSRETPSDDATKFYVLESMSGGDMGDYSAEEYYDLMESMGIEREDALIYILMHTDGTVQMVSFGMLIEGTWEDGVFTFSMDGETMTMEYTTARNTLTTTGDDGGKTVYTLSNDTPPKLPEATAWEDDDYDTDDDALIDDPVSPDDSDNLDDDAGNTDDTANEYPEYLSWWDGDWYGYWLVDSTGSYYDFLEDGIWDCYAVIKTNADGTATVYLWDDEDELGTIEIQLHEAAGGIMGGATSEEGELFGYPIGHADWLIHPDIEDYENMIVIREKFEDSDGDWFDYEIYLRPWGTLWNDVPEDSRPQDYDAWYVGGNYYRENMLDALADSTISGEPVFIHPGAVNSGGSSTSSVELTFADFGTFSIGFPSNSEMEEDVWGDMVIKDSDGRYEVSYMFYYSEDSFDSAREDMKDYENGTSDYAEFTQVIGGIQDVFAIKYNSFLWNEAKFSVAFQDPIDNYYGILFEVTALDTDNKIDDVLAYPEVQAILGSIRFK